MKNQCLPTRSPKAITPLAFHSSAAILIGDGTGWTLSAGDTEMQVTEAVEASETGVKETIAELMVSSPIERRPPREGG